MGDTDVNTEVAAWAGINLECFCGTDGLHNVGVTTLGLCASKPRLQTVNIQGLRFISFATAWSIAPGHGGA